MGNVVSFTLFFFSMDLVFTVRQFSTMYYRTVRVSVLILNGIHNCHAHFLLLIIKLLFDCLFILITEKFKKHTTHNRMCLKCIHLNMIFWSSMD